MILNFNKMAIKLVFRLQFNNQFTHKIADLQVNAQLLKEKETIYSVTNKLNKMFNKAYTLIYYQISNRKDPQLKSKLHPYKKIKNI